MSETGQRPPSVPAVKNIRPRPQLLRFRSRLAEEKACTLCAKTGCEQAQHALHTELWSSLNQLVGAGKQRGRNCESELLGSLHVDAELHFCDQLHRQVGGFFAVENAAGIDPDLAVHLR